MGRFIFVSFSLLVVFLSLSGTGADLECPPDWSSYDRYCYLPVKEPQNWYEAERFCTEQAKGGHLVSIETSLEAALVDNVLSGNKEYLTRYVWIGLRVQNKGQPCSSISYENLVDPFECFMVRKDASRRNWFNVDCRQQLSFMCKFTRPR
uniref:C-type lectin 4 n=1 Tax=Crotalus helleri TaxID=8741 RepID=G9DCI0_CROHE|nr:C-type lectin 4 [Crotalus oreganus helleri]